MNLTTLRCGCSNPGKDCRVNLKSQSRLKKKLVEGEVGLRGRCSVEPKKRPRTREFLDVVCGRDGHVGTANVAEMRL